jgi:hypothetical protein
MFSNYKINKHQIYFNNHAHNFNEDYGFCWKP